MKKDKIKQRIEYLKQQVAYQNQIAERYAQAYRRECIRRELAEDKFKEKASFLRGFKCPCFSFSCDFPL